VCSGRIDVHPRPWEPHELTTTASKVSSFMGLEIPLARLIEIAEGLDLAPRTDGDTIICSVPSYRVDLEREADLIEEFVRHVGFDAIPAKLPVLATAPGRRNPNWELVDRARSAGVNSGLAEVMTWSFIDPASDAEVESLPLCPGTAVQLDNPLASTQATMRRSLLPGLLSAVRDNLNQGERSVAVFEQGRVFWLADDAPAEGERLAAALVGSAPGEDRAVDFADLKGVVEGMVDELGFPPLTWRRGGGPWLDQAQGAVVETDGGRIVGSAGRVASAVATRWEIKAPVFAAELDLAAAAREIPLPKFVELPRYPAVTADMTIEHPMDLSFAELHAAVHDLADDLVEAIDHQNRFSGKGLPSGAVRSTLRLTYRAADRSLTQNEVNEQQEALREGLSQRLGVTFA